MLHKMQRDFRKGHLFGQAQMVVCSQIFMTLCSNNYCNLAILGAYPCFFLLSLPKPTKSEKKNRFAKSIMIPPILVLQHRELEECYTLPSVKEAIHPSNPGVPKPNTKFFLKGKIRMISWQFLVTFFGMVKTRDPFKNGCW